MSQPSTLLPLDALRAAFGDAFQQNASLAGHTTAHAGGPADALIAVHSAGELEQAVRRLWELDAPFVILGYGSNVLVSDRGLRCVAVLNRARAVEFHPGSDAAGDAPFVQAESGALISAIARLAALRGLGGFEWAATVPGTLGGAVYGNAGAFGGDMNGSLLLAEILHPHGKEVWPVERMQYSYRSSELKRSRVPAAILAARIRLERSDQGSVQAKMEDFSARRRRTQPPGASLGSMFKNPPGDYAGRLIEAAGLKGARVGAAEISPVHANFFVNHGGASASDIGRLIHLARETVASRFGVRLELEIELLGDWSTVLEDAAAGLEPGRVAKAQEKDER
jgi:UDP-N-acetylmuramate dehydrogenase